MGVAFQKRHVTRQHHTGQEQTCCRTCRGALLQALRPLPVKLLLYIVFFCNNVNITETIYPNYPIGCESSLWYGCWLYSLYVLHNITFLKWKIILIIIIARCKCQYKNVAFWNYNNVWKPTLLWLIFKILKELTCWFSYPQKGTASDLLACKKDHWY